MRITSYFLSLALLILTAATVRAQEEVPQFTVQIGNFVNPKPGDFSHLQKLGFVYASKRPNNYADVFVGGYGTEAAANKVVLSLKEKGYDNAFVSKLNVDGGQSVTVVQLATKSVGEKIDWESLLSAERVYVLLNGNQIKIFTGFYPDVETAKAQLPRLNNLGFKGAFVKNVNNALLHEVTEFEAGGAAKKPLIPLDFAGAAAEQERIEVEKRQAETKAAENQKPEKKTDVPRSYDQDVAIISPQKEVASATKSSDALTAKGLEVKSTPAKKSAAPEIRPTFKRTSALEMQKVLKAQGSYKGSLDGFYGKGTKAAYELELNSNRQLEKYRLLSDHLAQPENEAPRGTLQFYINNLWQDSKSALDGLEVAKAPVAKAYRAYYLFVNEGVSQDVNRLMNEAIREAFANNKSVNLPRFDYKATYAYVDLDQLLLHIRYIHQVSPTKIAAPCWLFQKHPGVAMRAFEPKGSGDNEFLIQSCGGFWEWNEVRMLHAMAQDIAAQSQISEAKLAASQSELARLYLTPKALDEDARKAAESWNAALWKGIQGWATRDPMLEEMSTALRISYLQSQVLLEDFFMDEGFNEKESKALALAALMALVGHQLERFI